MVSGSLWLQRAHFDFYCSPLAECDIMRSLDSRDIVMSCAALKYGVL